MVSLKGTQTEKNLLIAFAGESQARNRYTMYASQAKKDGYHAISKIFLETADQEKEHASRLFKFLEGGDLEITASFPAGKIGTTFENLQAAAYGDVAAIYKLGDMHQNSDIERNPDAAPYKRKLRFFDTLKRIFSIRLLAMLFLQKKCIPHGMHSIFEGVAFSLMSLS